MGGWCILSISPCQPLHAVGYSFDCANIVCLIFFPSINQTLKQNYPSQLEKISRFLKEHEPEVFLKHTHIPIYQSSVQCDVCVPSHLATMSVTKGRASPRWKNFLAFWKMSWTYCMHNHCFRACYRCKIWASLRKLFASPWCPKLVTGLLVTVALWLLSALPLSSVFSQSHFSGLTSNFNRRN